MLEVLACPAPAGLQDLGRHGFRHLGVPLSGALDAVSLRLANALVGNPPQAAALEMRLVGPRLRARTPTRVALANATAVVERGDGETRKLPAWRSMQLAPGDCLRIGAVAGVGYLAVAGGFAVPAVLGSRATYARAGFGSVIGEGTTLPLGTADPDTGNRSRDLAVAPAPTFDDGSPLRAMPGPQGERFTDEAVTTFFDAAYTVTRDADRMGLRLAGPPLAHVGGADIVSDAVTPGAIQVPGDGQPIVLLADCQTVGGYAKIATVISADLPRLGRLLPGATVRFARVTAAQAREARQAQEDWLAQTIAGLRLLAADELDLDALYSSNLVAGVIHAE